MLSRLSIRNYAIIDHLEVDFSSHLNIITGETGAGKSIIIGALGLILGQRAESNVLLNKEKKCIVEGYFRDEARQEHVIAFLRKNELDVLEELVVRREIAPAGKSRAFINDTPVNLSQLNQLSSLLVDLHQQFDTLDLGEADFQREVLDALAGNSALLKAYGEVYKKMTEAGHKLEELKTRKDHFNKELDYHQFQFNELEEAGFKENELEDLDQELKMLTNAESINRALEKVLYELEEGESPVLMKLKQVTGQLHPFHDLLPGLRQLEERIQSAYIELQDISAETSLLKDKINLDEEAADRINERIGLGYKLLKKHGVKTTADLLVIKEDLENKLREVLNMDDAIAEMTEQYQGLQKEAEKMAQKISSKRKEQEKPLSKQVNEMLVRVGMPNARIKIEILKKELSSNGMDEISFLFDANKSNQFHPLRKVASGGELSRLMLCIKSLVARSMDLPTLIFDEIDTGISGEAARQVGAIMKELAESRQVLCITHQPQIAGKADAHYLVYKEVINNTITTGVRILNTDERIIAIARMLSGEKPTAAAMENAREMVMN
jgi:DNA repair protein RecN (Recombination protein N)